MIRSYSLGNKTKQNSTKATHIIEDTQNKLTCKQYDVPLKVLKDSPAPKQIPCLERVLTRIWS